MQTAAPQPSDPPNLPLAVVHVTGQVVEPGVVRVRADGRVIDAIRAAGGFTSEADQSALNLARPLVDGEQLWVGRPGEDPPAHVTAAQQSVSRAPALGGDGTAPAGGSAGGAGGDVPGGTIDLNSATAPELESLPGVGPSTAAKILAWRDEHGRFTAVDELLEVSGIGERKLAEIAPHVVVGP